MRGDDARAAATSTRCWTSSPPPRAASPAEPDAAPDARSRRPAPGHGRRRDLRRPAGQPAAAGPEGALAALAAGGIGGPRMIALGFDAWWPADKLSLFGYVDVLMHYRELVGIRNALGDRLIAERPDVFVGVDAPDFNFGLEKRLKAAGIKTVHFVCPSIWAWRGERVQTLGGVGRPRAVPVPVRARAAARARHQRPPTSAIRWPGDPAGARARRRARRCLCAETTQSWRCCPAAAARRSSCIAPRVLAAAATAPPAAGPALRAAGRAGLRALVEPLRRAMRRRADRRCSTAARTTRWPPATSRSSPAAPPRSRRRCSSGRWSSPTS